MSPKFSAACGLLTAAGCASGQIPVYIETFDNNTNAGTWSFGAPNEGIQLSGGASGPYLRGSGLDTTIPFLRTGAGTVSSFTGDYRARRINVVRVGLNVFRTDFPLGSGPPAVIL